MSSQHTVKKKERKRSKLLSHFPQTVTSCLYSSHIFYYFTINKSNDTALCVNHDHVIADVYNDTGLHILQGYIFMGLFTHNRKINIFKIRIYLVY